MNEHISKYLFYIPATLAKGELIYFYQKGFDERQWWDVKKITDYQMRQNEKVISFAVENSAFYKKRISSTIDQLSSSWTDNIPTISKNDLINNIADISVPRVLRIFDSVKTTGGSTGEPVKIIKNASALARERCATWRGYEWAGIRIGDRQIRFWGVPHQASDRFKANIVDYVSNRKRISAFSINKESMRRYYKEITKFNPKYIYGYVSVIKEFANFIKENGLAPPASLVALITTSEVLAEPVRNFIEEVFQRKVFNEYGCGEVGSIAHECSHGRMHVMADNLKVEVDAVPGEPGEIVVTDFFNYATPLIRYRLGDFATLSGELCPCGRGLPTIEKIHGRAYDIIETPSGEKIHPESIIYIFENIQKKKPIFKQFKVVQERIDLLKVFIVPNASWESSQGRELKQQIKTALAYDFDVHIELIDEISRERSGKMRVVKSMLK